MPNGPIEWTKWGEDVIKEYHGPISDYRKLYDGDHTELFGRAKDLVDKGEIVDNITEGKRKAINVRPPYIIANVAKLIPEIPATLVARSIGKIQSSVKSTDEQNESLDEETEKKIDGPNDDSFNGTVLDIQNELIKQIDKNSKLQFEHWSNIVAHQVDGGLVGCVWEDERGIRLEFKQRDVYFPHEDELGSDLAYYFEREDEKYLHVYRERVEENGLRTSNMLFSIGRDSKTNRIDDEKAKEILGMKETDKLEVFYEGRNRPFIQYWANEKTFSHPYGKSVLKDQFGKQDEINWTLTRSGLTFERNGKPRLAVSKEVFQALQDAAQQRYGDETKIDHRDLEITTMDDQGKSLEVIQIDITKIGDIQWVKDLMKLMFVETRTSEKAVDFYMDEGGSPAQSGVAKFYDLFTSISKADQLQKEYIYFLQQLFESALWLANQDDPAVIIEEPEITVQSMVPVSRKELIEENMIPFNGSKQAQSLETTVRRINPHASEEWIQEEIVRIEEEATSSNSMSAGAMTLANFMDNPADRSNEQETNEEEEEAEDEES
ncbi:hypothetical protein [Virgibacillus sp. 7505]|uniref:hypothetical protein n=1 Tax=Virgibacillus sp. 7505 TaxID=2022548 RepID=UPI0015959436|nr:hypothetical protein [Virgibacillus sp. 7505]